MNKIKSYLIENYPGFKNNFIKSHIRFINIDEDNKYKHLFEGINYLKVVGILSDNSEVLLKLILNLDVIQQEHFLPQ
tara:strand:+ start:259 stop:489 length:231 start_codon:yes stop_codon:yes gene_type:complete